MGFDESSLGYKPVNPLTLSSLMRTESLNGYFMWQSIYNNYITDVENRFVSFYSNAAYCFDNRYDITGSIRVDNQIYLVQIPSFNIVHFGQLVVRGILCERSFGKVEHHGLII